MSIHTEQDIVEVDTKLTSWVDAHADEIIQTAGELIRIPSVKGAPAPGAPFGTETRRALDYVMDVGRRYGLETKMVAGYAAHLQHGTGEKLVGILSHVDVVPVGNGEWHHDPFLGEVLDGKLYGRGAIDDKGPGIAALYGLLAVRECGIPTSVRYRAIFGADEESGMDCMRHYFANEEMPDTGFTPDGVFPCIHAEKGIAEPVISIPMARGDHAVWIESMSGGTRSNMVPDHAEARIKGVASISAAELAAAASTRRVLVETSGNSLKIRATGISAHASKPNEGVSAVALLCDALKHIAGLGAQMKVVDAIGKLAHDSAGSALGIACSDTVCGALTSNLGVLRFDSGDTPRLTASFSVRYPVTASWDELLPKLETAVNAIGFSLVSCSNSNPLYLPATDPLIETLISVYRSETADDQTPLQTMGGGTYARMLKHGVAFGPDFPGTPGLAHKVDESWSVDQLMTSTRIYARAIARIGLQP